MDSATQQGGAHVGQNIGDSAGSTAASSMTKQLLNGIAAAGLGTFLQGEISKVLDNGEVEASMKAKLNLNEKQLENISEASKTLMKGNYAESYAEASKTMEAIVGSVKGASNMTSDELAKMGRDMANLTSEYELDSAAVTKAVSSMVGTGFAKDSTEAMSIILAGMQSFDGSGDDFIDTLQEFSNGFVKVGVTGEASVALINEALKHGLKDTDAFGDSLKEFDMLLSEAADAGEGGSFDALTALGLDPKSVNKAMKAGGQSAQDMLLQVTGKLKEAGRSDLWTQVFGPKAQEYFTTYQNMDWNQLKTPLAEGTGDLDKFDKNLTTVMDVLIGFKNMIEIAFTDTLEPAVKKVAPLIEGLANFLTTNKDAATALGLAVSGVLIVAVAGLTIALWGLIAPIVANPATWILAGILLAVAALAAGVWWLADNWTEVNNWMKETWGGFVGFLEDSSGNIWTAFETTGNEIKRFFNEATVNVINSINSIITALNGIRLPDWMGGQAIGGLNLALLDVPEFATGGTIAPSKNGSIIRVAEAGRAESIVDTGTVNRTLELTNQRLTSGAGGGLTVQIIQQPGESPMELFNKLKQVVDLHGLTL
jgi:phage host-nuclease inhibitor protein Gam